jgi:LPS O-antigen subunit length determinant protein (WzzB/FepE family)
MIKKYQRFLEEIKISKNITTEEAFSEFIEQLEECGNHYGKEDLKRGENFKINVTRRGDEFRISI